MEMVTMFHQISQVDFWTELSNGKYVKIEHSPLQQDLRARVTGRLFLSLLLHTNWQWVGSMHRCDTVKSHLPEWLQPGRPMVKLKEEWTDGE
jgi:hypothetical protein